MENDYWGKNTLEFLTFHLGNATQIVRIATGFFTVEGYNLLREVLKGKQVRLMVGYDEQSRDRLREKLIEDVMRHLNVWSGINRREAVVALVEALQKKWLVIHEQPHSHIVDARIRTGDHAKVYIVDKKWAAAGSSNLTASGLKKNKEATQGVDDPAVVERWVKQFDQYWDDPKTVDLTQLLLERLLAWLELRPPFDVYLKTIKALIGDDQTSAPRTTYKMPVLYQRVVIERVLRQIKDWGGAFLVASTGLGKTVMATDVAYRLRQENKIFNVIVFAPKQTLPDWHESLSSAGVANEVFTRNLLDQPLTNRTGKLQEVISALQRADDKTMIIVDESHYFQNMKRAKDGKDRHSFDRLSKSVSEHGAKIMLLTATPFAKGLDDLNNQLSLLPHRALIDYRLANGQMVMPGIHDAKIQPTAWKVRDSETKFFEDFINLPVSTVISTSRVARDFSEHTPDGDYILFGEQKRWIPRVSFRKLKFPVLEEAAMTKALDEGYFRHDLKKFQNRGVWKRSEVTIQAQAETAWLSSPAALADVVEKVLNGTYKEKWKVDPKTQKELLKPLLTRLKATKWTQDIKFLSLVELVKQAIAEKRKVLIFSERHATAIYLEESLRKAIKGIKIACTSVRQNNEYALKDFDKEAYPLVANFAPEANADYWRDHEGTPDRLDLFITTDAYGAGVNLQDASVVVNYDLAWTPDKIIQRIGRILRLWKEPREVQVYVFVGRFDQHKEGENQTNSVEKRLRTLTERGQKAEQFSELPFFTEDQIKYHSLSDLAEVVIEELGTADTSELEEFTGVSGYLRHISTLKEHSDYLQTIPDDISSARVYPEKEELLYLLLRHNESYHWVLFDIEQQTISVPKEDQLLNLIACTKEEPIAEVDASMIELYAQKCRDLWVQKNSVQTNVDVVERICVLYLQPYQLTTEVEGFLKI